MSKVRRSVHPWLADHVVFFVVRWISWLATIALLWWFGGAGTLSSDIPLLLVSFGVNLLATFAAQAYARAAHYNPAILLVDVVYMVAVLLISDTWRWAFTPYAYAALIMPGLLFGWRGGVMAGLAFVTLDLATSTFVGNPPNRIMQEQGWSVLAAMMVLPPFAAAVFPSLVQALRWVAQLPTQGASPTKHSPAPRSDRPRQASGSRGAAPKPRERDGRSRVLEAITLTPTATVHAPDSGLDDTRHVIFAPLTHEGIELAAALDVLATRFGQHTGLHMRVTMLGRSRPIRRAQYGVIVRVAQEALLNVQQHAHAAAVDVTLRYDASSVALLIQDDGVGLLDGTFERPGLHALRAMYYRVAELGGRLDVFEAASGGVCVRATVPLE